MPREVTAEFAAEAAKTTGPRPIVFLEAEFDPADPLRLYSGLGEKSWDGKIWHGGGALVEVAPLTEESSNRASSFQVTLRAGHASFGAAGFFQLAATTPCTGRPFRLWRGFLDETGEVIPDPVRLLAGRMDTLQITASGPDRKVVLRVERLSKRQNAASGLRHSHAEHMARVPGDRFFQFLAGMRDRTIRWPVFSRE